MKTKTSVFRLAVILLFLLGVMNPLATTGAGAAAQAVRCDDFSTREEAQNALDDDPNTAETLDEDGDGIACEDLPTEAEATSDDGVRSEDVQLPGGDDDATEEATEEPTEDATAEDEEPTEDATAENEPSGGDVDEYVTTVQDEADSLQTSVDRFIEIDDEAAADPTRAELRDLADEANEIAATWAEYPDVAAEITATAPDGVEDIDAAYQDLAETTGQTGDDWAVYWETPEDTPEEDEAFDAFTESFATMQDQLDELNLLLEEGAATPDATPEGTPETSDDGDAYIATIQDEVDAIETSWEDFSAALDVAADESNSETEREDAIDEFTTIAEGWSEYPEVAAEIEAPEGFEEIDEAYQDLAADVGEMGDNWALFLETEPDTPEADEAEDAFSESVENVQSGIDDLNTLLEDAGTGGDATAEATEDATEEPTEDATEEPSGDADEYLTAVRDNSDELSESIDRFNEIVAAGDFTDEQVTEVGEILALWAEAPDAAAELDAPTEFSEIDDTYVELTEELASASESFAAYGQADADSPEADEALRDFQDALENAETLAADLDDLLTDEGV